MSDDRKKKVRVQRAARVTIYTDGSHHRDKRRAGAGVFIFGDSHPSVAGGGGIDATQNVELWVPVPSRRPTLGGASDKKASLQIIPSCILEAWAKRPAPALTVAPPSSAQGPVSDDLLSRTRQESLGATDGKRGKCGGSDGATASTGSSRSRQKSPGRTEEEEKEEEATKAVDVGGGEGGTRGTERAQSDELQDLDPMRAELYASTVALWKIHTTPGMFAIETMYEVKTDCRAACYLLNWVYGFPMAPSRMLVERSYMLLSGYLREDKVPGHEGLDADSVRRDLDVLDSWWYWTRNCKVMVSWVPAHTESATAFKRRLGKHGRLGVPVFAGATASGDKGGGGGVDTIEERDMEGNRRADIAAKAACGDRCYAALGSYSGYPLYPTAPRTSSFSMSTAPLTGGASPARSSSPPSSASSLQTPHIACASPTTPYSVGTPLPQLTVSTSQMLPSQSSDKTMPTTTTTTAAAAVSTSLSSEPPIRTSPMPSLPSSDEAAMASSLSPTPSPSAPTQSLVLPTCGASTQTPFVPPPPPAGPTLPVVLETPDSLRHTLVMSSPTRPPTSFCPCTAAVVSPTTHVKNTFERALSSTQTSIPPSIRTSAPPLMRTSAPPSMQTFVLPWTRASTPSPSTHASPPPLTQTSHPPPTQASIPLSAQTSVPASVSVSIQESVPRSTQVSVPPALQQVFVPASTQTSFQTASHARLPPRPAEPRPVSYATQSLISSPTQSHQQSGSTTTLGCVASDSRPYHTNVRSNGWSTYSMSPSHFYTSLLPPPPPLPPRSSPPDYHNAPRRSPSPPQQSWHHTPHHSPPPLQRQYYPPSLSPPRTLSQRDRTASGERCAPKLHPHYRRDEPYREMRHDITRTSMVAHASSPISQADFVSDYRDRYSWL